MEATFRATKFIALGILSFAVYKLLVLAKPTHEAVANSRVQLLNSVSLGVDLALHYTQWAVLICLALLSLVFMLFNIWRFQTVEKRLRRLTGR
jgi:hypothetical protein